MVISACALTEEESNIVRGINCAIKKIEARHCCGGSLAKQEIRIWYSKEEEGASQEVLKLPAHPYDDSSIEDLIGACSPLPTEDDFVHELQPRSFATNFELGQCFIMDEIQRLLAPGAVLRAQLKSLTVIETGGEQQGGEASSGKEEDELGYLVIGLPVAFTGGEIAVTNPAGRSHTFSWGGLETTIQWAAFITGSKLKVSEVTSGYQLRLNYKLFKLGESYKRKRVLGVSDTLIDAQSLPLYEILCEARDCSKFYAGGRRLGFATQKLYEPGEESGKYKESHRDEKPWLLTGGDAMLFAAGKAAGLKVELRPVYRNGGTDPPAVLYLGKVVGEKAPAFLGDFKQEFDGLDGDTSSAEELPRVREGVETDAEIGWCLKNFVWKRGGGERGLKDEDGEVPWFYTTAVIVWFPSWAQRQEKEDGEPERKKVKDFDEAITEWFRKAEDRVSREIDYDFQPEEKEDDGDDESSEEEEEAEEEEEGDVDGEDEEEDEDDGDGIPNGDDGGAKDKVENNDEENAAEGD